MNNNKKERDIFSSLHQLYIYKRFFCLEILTTVCHSDRLQSSFIVFIHSFHRSNIHLGLLWSRLNEGKLREIMETYPKKRHVHIYSSYYHTKPYSRFITNQALQLIFYIYRYSSVNGEQIVNF